MGMRRLLAISLALAFTGCARGTPAADFTLRTDSASEWSLSAQRGKAVVLTFGYTHCGDTCPLTLAKLAQAMRTLGPRAKDVEVVFVTVDPQRDTPDALRAYLQKFGDGFTGLTGTPEQLAAVEQAYHVWAQRIPGKRGRDDYDDAHASAIFFIDTSGHINSFHDASDSVGELARAASESLG
jgi:protein SCO1/2